MPDFSLQLVIANGVLLITALPLSLWGIWSEKSSLCWFFSLKSAFFGVHQGTAYLFAKSVGQVKQLARQYSCIRRSGITRSLPICELPHLPPFLHNRGDSIRIESDTASWRCSNTSQITSDRHPIIGLNVQFSSF